MEHDYLPNGKIIVDEDALIALLERIDYLIDRAKYYNEHTGSSDLFVEIRDRTSQILRGADR